MIVKDLTTRQYGKLFNNLVGDFKAPIGDFEGIVRITRLRKYNDNKPMYYGGEVDVVFVGKIMANNGRWYTPHAFGKKVIRKFIRRKFDKTVNSHTRLFGIDNVKICKISFEK
jgi:hypothetical protein